MKNNVSKSLKFARAPRLVDLVTKFLSDQIEKKTYDVGEKLPSEWALADQLGVSRTVIRESLSRLIYDGLLQSRQGSGFLVADSEQKRTFRLEPFEDSKAIDTKYLLELRATLEGEAAFLAAKRRTPDHIKKLEDCLEDMGKHHHSTDLSIGEDIKFHELISEASCNPYLIDLMTFIRNRLKFLVAKTHGIHKESTSSAADVHNQIFQAILNKDSEEARKASIHHIQVAASGLNIKIFD